MFEFRSTSNRLSATSDPQHGHIIAVDLNRKQPSQAGGDDWAARATAGNWGKNPTHDAIPPGSAEIQSPPRISPGGHKLTHSVYVNGPSRARDSMRVPHRTRPQGSNNPQNTASALIVVRPRFGRGSRANRNVLVQFPGIKRGLHSGET